MPSGKVGPHIACGLGEKKPGMPPMIVDRLASELPNIDDCHSWSIGVFLPTPVQNSCRRAMRFSGSLPAMMAPLIAPIEVPMTQSGLMPPSISLVDAGLVGAKSASSLQDEDHLFL